FLRDAPPFSAQGELAPADDVYGETSRGFDDLMWVDRRSIPPDLEVQVRLGRAAGTAAQCDDLVSLHAVVRRHEQLRRVAVQGLVAVRMANTDVIPVHFIAPRGGDHPDASGPDVRTFGHDNVDSRVLAGDQCEAFPGDRTSLRERPRARSSLLARRRSEKLRVPRPPEVVVGILCS